MKIIPVYLPQFHCIPENDEWWGKGFTEWVNVKNATPLFKGHYQPRVPLDDNYYDLSRLETLEWQCRTARKYGIYGFCMYHYWFNGRLLLEKPMEMLLAHPEIDMNYCISWANHDWNDGWKASDRNPRTLIAHDFDDEKDWTAHFNYMLPFFKDPRYITENNKPFLVIYAPHFIRKISKMLDLWTDMARRNGFEGLTYIYQSAAACLSENWDRSRFDYGVEMNPGYAKISQSGTDMFKIRLTRYARYIKSRLGIRKSLSIRKKSDKVTVLDYDSVWERILALHPRYPHMIPGAFVDWDNTPRYKGQGYLYQGASPEKFKEYFRRLLLKTEKEYKTDKIFVFAWNEWAEGGYLEPDKRYGYGYLEAIEECLEEFQKKEPARKE